MLPNLICPPIVLGAVPPSVVPKLSSPGRKFPQSPDRLPPGIPTPLRTCSHPTHLLTVAPLAPSYGCLCGVLRGRIAPWPFVGPSPVVIVQHRASGRFLFRSTTIAAPGVPTPLLAKRLLNDYDENRTTSNDAGVSGKPVEEFHLVHANY